ncbi:MAG: methylated-DNA--[protein]-cysteine S-methyltransferase [Phycisphaerales bacterium]
MPSRASMLRAVRDRDATSNGLFYFAVTTTGVFCRPHCKSRAAREEHIEFFPTAQEALLHGYRACKRCRPDALRNANEPPAVVQQLLNMITDAWPAPVRMRHVIEAGLPFASEMRAFKAHTGLSFAAYQRAKRVGAGLSAIRKGTSMASAQLAAGFGSSSGFRHAIKQLLGQPPSKATSSHVLHAAWLESPLGPMIAVIATEPAPALVTLDWIDRKGLERELLRVRAKLGGADGEAAIVASEHPLLKDVQKQLKAYFANAKHQFTIPLHESVGTDFQRRVWGELCRIPIGKTRSYLQQATALKDPKAVRAVALANGANFRGIVIPCHRVIGSDGSLTGYGGGLDRKRWLLEHEEAMQREALFE